jgi:ankyrin repeat protein
MGYAAPEAENSLERIKTAFRADDHVQVRKLLDRHAELKERINDPVGPFESPAVVNVRSRPMLDVLLDAGADINARSRWWAGGFGLLDSANPDLAAYALARGAVLDAHSASRLGLMDRLRELIARNPKLLHARGGDGQTPLHFASTVEIAAHLLDRGAEIDARDVDHESTPVQWMLKDRQDVARYLISRECQTDILMAAALGDLELVRRHLDADPGCIRIRVNEEFFPMINPKAGGTIYQWTLGFYVSVLDVSRKFGHDDVLRLLVERSPKEVQLIDACWTGDEEAAREIRAANPEIAHGLSEADFRLVAHAARNNETAVVRLMLEYGFPVDAKGQHQATPLHWAAFHGNAEMTRIILPFQPSLEATDADFQGTPLGWAIHGSEHGWHCKTGDYRATVAALLDAGAKRPPAIGGSPAVQEVLSRSFP